MEDPVLEGEARVLRRSFRRGRLVGALWSAALVALVLGVTALYVSAERTFYHWDYAAYHEIASGAASAFRTSTGAGLQYLQDSYRGDYNALFALPLVPALLVFGDSRLVFELALAACYLVPLALAIGALAARVVPAGGPAAVRLGTAAALTVPMTWVPTLRGFPDAGAAALLTAASVAFLRDDRLRRWQSVLLIGSLLGLAVVFRRHFAYGVAAFLLAILVDAVVRREAPAAPRLRALLALALRVGLIGAVAIAIAVAVGREFVSRMAAHDFRSLYRSYEMPLGSLTEYFFRCYGAATVLLAAAGFAAAIRSPLGERRAARFVLTVAASWWALWCLAVRQVGEQYTLYLTPAIAVGLVLLLSTPLPGRLRHVAVGLVVLSSVANLVLGLWGPVRVPRDLEPVVVGRWGPLVRSDYAEIAELMRFLRSGPEAEGAVFVVGSSECLNASLLRSADQELRGDAPALDVPLVPTVDSDGYYPLSALLSAHHLLLGRPFQHHLAPDQQLVLRTVYDTFAGSTGMARDFSLSPRSFGLEGCAVSVFERTRPTPPGAALALLRAFEERTRRRPGMQPDWNVIDRRFPTWVSRNPDGSTSIVAHPAPRGQEPATTLAAVAQPPGPVTAEGIITFGDSRCAGATLRFEAIADGGAGRTLREEALRPEQDGRFRVDVELRPGERLLLSVLDHSAGASIDYCLLTIDPLRLASAPTGGVRP